MFNLSEITVAILAGGLGKRLRSVVSKQPKVLAEVGDSPFLQKLLDQISFQGIKNVVLCTGYLGEQIKKKFGTTYKNLNLLYSQEDVPLGTGGALRLALPLLNSEHILVMNGDSFCNIDFKDFLKLHLNKKANATLALVNTLETDRFGKVNLGLNDKIDGFVEKKKGNESGFINAGIYLLKRSLISEFPQDRSISLEKEVFPKWVSRSFYGYKSSGHFIDIGTPQSYSQAEELFKQGIKKRFILLDRDGTLVVQKPYLSHPDQIELISGVVEALKEFKRLGLGVVVITNQSVVGRGHISLETLDKIHQRLTDLLLKEGIVLDGIYFCPHTPEDNCLCRKPKIELIEKAVKEHKFDPKLSFVIGDNKSDVELGKNVEATTILVKTGHGMEIAKDNSVRPDFIAEDLFSSLEMIKSKLAQEK